jgi:two-component system sensor histidine kinase AdeS
MRAEMLATIGREAGDVSTLIEDLLVVARAEAGSLRVSCVGVDLRAQVAQVLEGLDPTTMGAITITTEPAQARGDPARVRQVIRNLITNALRYGGPDVTVRTVISDGRSHVLVLDNGVGIPRDEREVVFETYGQGSNATQVAASVGLGLPISRLLTEKMGGSLTYRYEDDHSVFDLELPAAP